MARMLTAKVEVAKYKEALNNHDIATGKVPMVSDVVASDEDARSNETAQLCTWSAVLEWLKADSGQEKARLKQYMTFFASKDQQVRGVNHHVAQTGKALFRQGLYANRGWICDIVQRAYNHYQTRKGPAGVGMAVPPFTMYMTRLAAAAAALSEIKKGDMREMFTSFDKVEDLPEGMCNILCEGEGLYMIGTCFAKQTVTVPNVWSDVKHVGIPTPMNSLITEDGRLQSNPQVKIVGVGIGETFPYTQFWCSAGMIPDDQIELGVLMANYWKDELADRPGRLTKIKSSDMRVNMEMNMSIHSYSWFIHSLWPAVKPARSPFAGKTLAEFEDFTEEAATLENLVVEWLAATTNYEPPTEVIEKGAEEDGGVWKQLAGYLEKQTPDVALVTNGLHKETPTTEEAAAMLEWKSKTQPLSVFKRAWGIMRFAPATFLQGDKILWIGKDKAPDLSTVPDSVKKEYELLKAMKKTQAATLEMFIRELRVRLGEAEMEDKSKVTDKTIQDLIDKAPKMKEEPTKAPFSSGGVHIHVTPGYKLVTTLDPSKEIRYLTESGLAALKDAKINKAPADYLEVELPTGTTFWMDKPLLPVRVAASKKTIKSMKTGGPTVPDAVYAAAGMLQSKTRVKEGGDPSEVEAIFAEKISGEKGAAILKLSGLEFE